MISRFLSFSLFFILFFTNELFATAPYHVYYLEDEPVFFVVRPEGMDHEKFELYVAHVDQPDHLFPLPIIHHPGIASTGAVFNPELWVLLTPLLLPKTLFNMLTPSQRAQFYAQTLSINNKDATLSDHNSSLRNFRMKLLAWDTSELPFAQNLRKSAWPKGVSILREKALEVPAPNETFSDPRGALFEVPDDHLPVVYSYIDDDYQLVFIRTHETRIVVGGSELSMPRWFVSVDGNRFQQLYTRSRGGMSSNQPGVSYSRTHFHLPERMEPGLLLTAKPHGVTLSLEEGNRSVTMNLHPLSPEDTKVFLNRLDESEVNMLRLDPDAYPILKAAVELQKPRRINIVVTASQNNVDNPREPWTITETDLRSGMKTTYQNQTDTFMPDGGSFSIQTRQGLLFVRRGYLMTSTWIESRLLSKYDIEEVDVPRIRNDQAFLYPVGMKSKGKSRKEKAAKSVQGQLLDLATVPVHPQPDTGLEKTFDRCLKILLAVHAQRKR